jgi:anaerobic selenocysteine-containing dehydrogenase
MKLDRRSFLSFVIGGAAGTALTPLPWKLTDDLSIWTQMWPWTPVPPDGAYAYTNSACTLCPGGCGIQVRTVDWRAVKIEGMAGHPVNDGGICPLGLSGLQMLYGPSRVSGPLKRAGERGAGRWIQISWQEAIDEVAAKLSATRKAGRPQAVAAINGAGRGTFTALVERFMTVYGSPNLMRPASAADAYEMALYRMHGQQAMVGYDLENADFVLSFGSGVIDGWGSPVRMIRARSLWKERKVPLVQVEPRLSNTAAQADRWVAVAPGTEAALALGMAHTILSEGLYDYNFVSFYSEGFEPWRQMVLAEFAPEKVAQITGVDKEVIVGLAREFAKARAGVALCGRGRGLVPGGVEEAMAVHSLNALVGAVNRKGGVWALPEIDYINWPEAEMDAAASDGLQQARIDGAGAAPFADARSLAHRFFAAVAEGKADPVEALLVFEANPLYTQPDTATVKTALDKIPFIVSFSSFKDETSQYADLILPNHLYLERYEDIAAPAGLNKALISLTQPVVAPQHNTRHAGDVVLALAGAIGEPVADAFPWENFAQCLEETLGGQWKGLKKKGYVAKPATETAGFGAFATPSGKFEFGGTYRAAVIEGDKAAFPLVLMAYDSLRIAGGAAANTPFMTKTVGDDILKGNDVFVEINPKTADGLGLREGQYAELSTPRGKARVRVHLTEGLRPGLVAMPRGLGHTGYDAYLANKGVNVNALIGPVDDPASGLDAACGIQAKLAKA